MAIEKKYFAIGEVAAQFDVSASLIRFWESQFEQIKPRKNRNGIRQYTREDIETFRLIYHLVKERGYTLNGAKEVLQNAGSLQDRIKAVESLQKIKEFLLKLRHHLKPE